jgi:hypothetical protein
LSYDAIELAQKSIDRACLLRRGAIIGAASDVLMLDNLAFRTSGLTSTNQNRLFPETVDEVIAVGVAPSVRRTALCMTIVILSACKMQVMSYCTGNPHVTAGRT